MPFNNVQRRVKSNFSVSFARQLSNFSFASKFHLSPGLYASPHRHGTTPSPLFFFPRGFFDPTADASSELERCHNNQSQREGRGGGVFPPYNMFISDYCIIPKTSLKTTVQEFRQNPSQIIHYIYSKTRKH